MRKPLQGYIGLGSNLGDRLRNMQDALNTLQAAKDVDVVQVSTVYESPAHGYESPNPYLNAVAEVEWDGTPLGLFQLCYKIEAAGGRHRGPKSSAATYEDRTIDLDVLWLEGVESVDGRLILPHPRAAQRAFVLVPWLELDPPATLNGFSLEDCLGMLPRDEVESVRRIPDKLVIRE